jgi:hypothetical protein
MNGGDIDAAVFAAGRVPEGRRWPHRLGAGGDRQALLQQSDKFLLIHTLRPARQRGAVEHQPMLEEILAAEELKIRILNLTVAQHLVGQVVHLLEDGEPRHQPRRQWRAAGPSV